jgi:pyruvate formate lyase activating enzyme
MIREAMLYEKLPEDRVRCFVCAHRCKINPGRRGLCGVRENKEGVLYTLVFGTLIAENIDPIEKKPFFHVYPASRSYSAPRRMQFRARILPERESPRCPAHDHDRGAKRLIGKDL